MAIRVTCPGCYRRFEVSDRFAGQKGPCPNCKTVIDIPKGEATVHAPDDFVSGGKTTAGKLILKPIAREESRFSPTQLSIVAGSIIGIMLVTWILGYAGLFKATTFGPISPLAMIGQLAISVFYCMMLYPFLYDAEDIDHFRGKNLHTRAAICGASFVITWWIFELVASYTFTGGALQWWILVPCFVLGVLAAVAALELSTSNAFMLYLLWVMIMVLLRWTAGFGWVWQIVRAVSTGDAPPPPDPSTLI